jgi:hypothetical protein
LMPLMVNAGLTWALCRSKRTTKTVAIAAKTAV